MREENGEIIWEETDYAWAAGIIDGEGCLSIRRSQSKIGNSRSDGVSCSIKVVMTCQKTITILEAMFGGSFYVKRSASDKCRTPYAWTVSSKKKVRDVLSKISMYLITKEKQSNMMIRFINDCPWGREIGGNLYYGLTKLQREKVNYYFEQMRILNLRGTAAIERDKNNGDS